MRREAIVASPAARQDYWRSHVFIRISTGYAVGKHVGISLDQTVLYVQYTGTFPYFESEFGIFVNANASSYTLITRHVKRQASSQSMAGLNKAKGTEAAYNVGTAMVT